MRCSRVIGSTGAPGAEAAWSTLVFRCPAPGRPPARHPDATAHDAPSQVRIPTHEVGLPLLAAARPERAHRRAGARRHFGRATLNGPGGSSRAPVPRLDPHRGPFGRLPERPKPSPDRPSSHRTPIATANVDAASFNPASNGSRPNHEGGPPPVGILLNPQVFEGGPPPVGIHLNPQVFR